MECINKFVDTRRLSLICAFAMYTSACYYWFSIILYAHDDHFVRTKTSVAIMWLARLLAFVHSPFLIYQMIGYLSYFPAWATNDHWEPKPLRGKFPPLIFRVVSRGDDVPVLQRGVECHSAILHQLGITDWLYQLVVEKPNDLVYDNVEVIVVPQRYQTPNKTLYKARNLHYALAHPSENYNKLLAIHKHLYLVHLDEETLVTAEAMRNCLELSRANKFRCGHGMVACGWNKVASPMATYVDSWIVNLYAGFMCTSVRFQNLTHVIRGGFFVVRNDLEEEIGWDFGTIFTAEDFRLARILDNKKEPTQFIDGVVLEESPVDVIGLIRQRSRWLVGQFRDVLYSKEKLEVSLPQFSLLCVWIGAPLTLFVLISGMFFGPFDFFIPILDDFLLFIIATEPFQYFYGPQLNFRVSPASRFLLAMACATQIPMIAAMFIESCGVLHSIFTFVFSCNHETPKFSFTSKAPVKRTSSNKLR